MDSEPSVVERIRQSRRRIQSESEDALRFLGRLRNARMVGAVAPSGPALARRIVSGIGSSSRLAASFASRRIACRSSRYSA